MHCHTYVRRVLHVTVGLLQPEGEPQNNISGQIIVEINLWQVSVWSSVPFDPSINGKSCCTNHAESARVRHDIALIILHDLHMQPCSRMIKFYRRDCMISVVEQIHPLMLVWWHRACVRVYSWMVCIIKAMHTSRRRHCAQCYSSWRLQSADWRSDTGFGERYVCLLNPCRRKHWYIVTASTYIYTRVTYPPASTSGNLTQSNSEIRRKNHTSELKICMRVITVVTFDLETLVNHYCPLHKGTN